jgi:hypothetical protein
MSQYLERWPFVILSYDNAMLKKLPKFGPLKSEERYLCFNVESKLKEVILSKPVGFKLFSN